MKPRIRIFICNSIRFRNVIDSILLSILLQFIYMYRLDNR